MLLTSQPPSTFVQWGGGGDASVKARPGVGGLVASQSLIFATLARPAKLPSFFIFQPALGQVKGPLGQNDLFSKICPTQLKMGL